VTGLKIFLFGKFSVQFGQEPLLGLDSAKAQELLCYLLLYRDRPHARESLASLLWDSCPTAQSKRYLRKTLWNLQSVLSSQVLSPNTCLLRVEPDWIQINPEAGLWVDVGAFEQAFDLTSRMPGRQLDLRGAELLCNALELYQGDLLEGWYQDWCLYERERFLYMYLTMLDKVISFCEANGKYEAGLAYSARILRYDRARERTHRQMMRLHYLAGDRTAALRQYERCVVALEEELGVRPARSTTALYGQIRADRLGWPSPAEGLTSAQATASPDVPACLDKLQLALRELQRQVQQAIEVIDRSIMDGQAEPP